MALAKDNLTIVTTERVDTRLDYDPNLTPVPDDAVVPKRLVGDYNTLLWRLSRYLQEYNLRRNGSAYHDRMLSPNEPLEKLAADCSEIGRALVDALDNLYRK